MAVARLELTPSIPTLASIDVKAANTDDKIANTNHIVIHLYLPQQYLYFFPLPQGHLSLG